MTATARSALQTLPAKPCSQQRAWRRRRLAGRRPHRGHRRLCAAPRRQRQWCAPAACCGRHSDLEPALSTNWKERSDACDQRLLSPGTLPPLSALYAHLISARLPNALATGACNHRVLFVSLVAPSEHKLSSAPHAAPPTNPSPPEIAFTCTFLHNPQHLPPTPLI